MHQQLGYLFTDWLSAVVYYYVGYPNWQCFEFVLLRLYAGFNFSSSASVALHAAAYAHLSRGIDKPHAVTIVNDMRSHRYGTLDKHTLRAEAHTHFKVFPDSCMYQRVEPLPFLGVGEYDRGNVLAV